MRGAVGARVSGEGVEAATTWTAPLRLKQLRTSLNDTMRVAPYTPIYNTTHLIFRPNTKMYGLHEIHLRALFAAI